MKFHDREYLTFDEVQERWKCSTNDLKDLIAVGRLAPCYVINHVAFRVRFSWQADCVPPYWLPVVVKSPSDVGEDVDETPSNLHDVEGMYYLLHPERTQALDCRFVYFSRDRNHTQGASTENECFMLSGGKASASQPISLDDVLKHGVFMVSEVERVEEEERDHSPKPEETVRRLTNLQIQEICKRFENKESVLSLSQSFGVHRRTIDEQLIRAGLKQNKPRKKPKGSAQGRIFRSGSRMK